VSIVVQDITPFLPEDTIAYLRLADEDRRFPFRPISSQLFLIGQGPGCDLRLGSAEMAAIHTAIQLGKDSAEIVQIAAEPPLLLNGEAVQKATLHHGDLIEIGDVSLAFFLCEEAAAVVSEGPVEPASLSPRQIVEGIESQLRFISSEDNSRERLGDMLKAAQQAVEACQFAQTIRFADYAPVAASTETMDRSPENQDLIQVRLATVETRLGEICNVLEQIVQQQQLIAAALQCVVERIDDLRASHQLGPLRASA